jgi:hypothetical protein
MTFISARIDCISAKIAAISTLGCGPRGAASSTPPQHHDLHEHRDYDHGHDLDHDSSTTHQAKQNNPYHQYNHTIQIKEVKAIQE